MSAHRGESTAILEQHTGERDISKKEHFLNMLKKKKSQKKVAKYTKSEQSLEYSRKAILFGWEGSASVFTKLILLC